MLLPSGIDEQQMEVADMIINEKTYLDKPEMVRIIGERAAYDNPTYWLIGYETRVERDGHRLIGGDTRAILADQSGAEVIVRTSIVRPYHAPWDAEDEAAMTARCRAPEPAEPAPEPTEERPLPNGIVTFLRSMEPRKREGRIALIARRYNIDPADLTAMVEEVQ